MNNGDFVESSSDSDNDGDDEDMDDVWDFIDNEEGKVRRRKRQNSTEETAPPLTPDIKVDLREALSQSSRYPRKLRRLRRSRNIGKRFGRQRWHYD